MGCFVKASYRYPKGNWPNRETIGPTGNKAGGMGLTKTSGVQMVSPRESDASHGAVGFDDFSAGFWSYLSILCLYPFLLNGNVF